MCNNCDKIEAEKSRVMQAVEQTIPCCLVCESPDTPGIGTWVAGKEHRLAVGDKDKIVSVFGFWLCEEHMKITPANERLITQIILQEIRQGKPQQI